MAVAERPPLGAVEQPRNPEQVSFSEGQVAFQARVLAATASPTADHELLNPNNNTVPEITSESLGTRQHRNYTIVKHASAEERNYYWEQRNVAVDARYQTWVTETQQAFDNSQRFFAGRKGQQWAGLFQKLNIRAVGFDTNDANTLYNRYFSSENESDNIDRFVNEVIDAHSRITNNQRQFDRASFEQNRDAIQWLANLFGEKSAQVMTQIADGETKPRAELAEAANANNRRNTITDKEYELFDFLYNPRQALRRPTPRRATHPEPAPVAPTPPEDEPEPVTETQQTAEAENNETEAGNRDWETLHDTFGHEVRWRNAEEIRTIFQSSPVKDLPVYYPGSLADARYPLAFTDATKFVFTDYIYVGEDGSPDENNFPDQTIQDIGGEILSVDTEGVLGQGGKRIITFNWGGKQRTITMYAEDATQFIPEEIRENDTSFIVIKAPTPFGRTAEDQAPAWITGAENFSNILAHLAEGGFIHRDPTHVLPAEIVGFRKRVEAPITENAMQHTPDGYPLYEKVASPSQLLDLLQMDDDLWIAKLQRNGDYLGAIDEQTITGYISSLSPIRERYLQLPEQLRQELLPSLQRELAAQTVSDEDRERIAANGIPTTEQQPYLQTIRERVFDAFPELRAA